MNHHERNRQQAALIVQRISNNLELAPASSPIRQHNLIRPCELRKYQLYALLAFLRRAEHSPRQQSLLSRVKRRLFTRKETWR